MIGKAILGNSFINCIKYCLNPKKSPKILEVNGIALGKVNFMARQYEAIANLKPGLKKKVWHTAISFAHQDKVDESEMVSIAEEYMDRMELKNNQWIIVRHRDTAHEHLHIIINRISNNGISARDWRCRFRTMKVMQELEIERGLTVASEQGNNRKEAIRTQIEKGLKLRENLDQIVKRVELLGYSIEYNTTSTGNVRGMSFVNKEKGILFKSSSIDRNFSYSKLLDQINQNNKQINRNL